MIPMNIQIVPAEDLIEHTDDDCVCGPEIRPHVREDGSIEFATLHWELGAKRR